MLRKIHSAKITGNIRLQLAKIGSIEINFESDCQTIIGTNGSGKSTLLREYSPLPPVSADYIKGGGKTIHFEDDKGVQYVAESENKHGWTHSLIRISDGVELNPGKTRQVQKQLIEQICGLTEELFDILVGDVTFTQMAPNKRREWILSFSGSDLEYAMKIYRDLNKRLMDSIALQKHYAKRLATELEGVMGEDQINDLRRSAKLCIERINLLMMERDSTVDPSVSSSQIIDHLARTQSLEEKIFSQIEQYKVAVPEGLNLDIASREDVDRAIGIIRSDISIMQRDLNAAYEEHATLDKYMKMLSSAGANGIDDLKLRVDELNAQLLDLQARRSLDITFNQPAQAQWALKSILFEVIELINLMPTDIPEYEMGGMRNAQQIREVRELIAKKQGELKEHDHKLYHMSNVDQVQCPQCTLVFAPGVDPNHVDQLKHAYGTVENQIATLDLKLNDLMDIAMEHDQYHQRTNRLQQIMHNNDCLSPLWNMIRSHIDRNEPTLMLNTMIHEYGAELDLAVQCDTIGQELYTRKMILDNAMAITQGHGDVNADRINSINTRITDTLNRMGEAKKYIQAIETFARAANDLDNLNAQYQDTVDQISALLLNYQLTLRNECLDEDIGVLQTQLASTQSTLSDATTAAALIEELRRNKKQADEDVAVHKSLVDGLSPNTGLIAKNIRTFIDGYVDQMNSFVGEVWTYPMKIIGCDIDAAVDCKFPLESEGELSGGVIKVVSPDISKSSSAQTDIINFAFRLTAMMCLGFEGYVLYLDEAGVRMDEKHRDRFNGLIERLLERKQVSQIFMISHYAAMHGVFTNADITVVDKTNIINIPREYNQNVTIEYLE